ncbi:MAG: FaeA/PapI family transcriptional regulator [Acinetobacter sp.]
MKNGRPASSDSFENRFQILVYATNNKSFKTADIALAVVSVSYQTIRIYLNELIQLGYIEKITTRDYRATDFAKQLFNVGVDGRVGDV